MTSLRLGDVPLAATDGMPRHRAPVPAAPQPAGGCRIVVQRQSDPAVGHAPAGAD